LLQLLGDFVPKPPTGAVSLDPTVFRPCPTMWTRWGWGAGAWVLWIADCLLE